MTAFSYSMGGKNRNWLIAEGPNAGRAGHDLINGPLTNWLHWVNYPHPDKLIACLKDTNIAQTVATEIERLAAQYGN